MKQVDGTSPLKVFGEMLAFFRLRVAVRDTENNGAGPVLWFGPWAWAEFTGSLK